MWTYLDTPLEGNVACIEAVALTVCDTGVMTVETGRSVTTAGEACEISARGEKPVTARLGRFDRRSAARNLQN